MKKILSIVMGGVMMFGLASCQNSNSKNIPADVVSIPRSAENSNKSEKQPKIVFENTTHDFGRVVAGEKVTFGYKFKNEGDKDLLIVKVSATCGCTAIDYPREPMSPGSEGVLYVTFNSTAKKGFQNKRVTVMANTQPSATVLWVKANVVNE